MRRDASYAFGSAVCHHLLNYCYPPSFEDFSVLCHETKKYLLELKETLFVMKDTQSVNRIIRTTPLYHVSTRCFVGLF